MSPSYRVNSRTIESRSVATFAEVVPVCLADSSRFAASRKSCSVTLARYTSESGEESFDGCPDLVRVRRGILFFGGNFHQLCARNAGGKPLAVFDRVQGVQIIDEHERRHRHTAPRFGRGTRRVG